VTNPATPTKYDRDDLYMSNCAGCFRELLSRRHLSLKIEDDRGRLPELVAERIADRPYCLGCVAVLERARAARARRA
jgi:hypothetical protein